MTIATELNKYQQRVKRCLTACLADTGVCGRLSEAVHYAVLLGGKCLRPLLVYTLGEALGLVLEELDHAACALELMHAYSLIHDDLPMMDNDDWRRDRPSCHKQFGEAIALLAGDALQARAFEVLTEAPLSPVQILAMLKVLARSVGLAGMVGGQAMELSRSINMPLSASTQETINYLKTGSLFRVALEFPGIIAQVSPETLLALGRLGYAIGQSYQLQDDFYDNQMDLRDIVERTAVARSSLLAIFQEVRGLLPSLSEQFLAHLLVHLPLITAPYPQTELASH